MEQQFKVSQPLGWLEKSLVFFQSEYFCRDMTQAGVNQGINYQWSCHAAACRKRQDVVIQVSP
ncbi:MAG: hypothetical protein GY935_13045 [Gammaproteobacteria bacterium]|nr:hypothetical protein [Gammaproteobacteria bacterium]